LRVTLQVSQDTLQLHTPQLHTRELTGSSGACQCNPFVVISHKQYSSHICYVMHITHPHLALCMILQGMALHRSECSGGQ
jgi:hypothetical protein